MAQETNGREPGQDELREAARQEMRQERRERAERFRRNSRRRIRKAKIAAALGTAALLTTATVLLLTLRGG